jgi:hypothetical protein
VMCATADLDWRQPKESDEKRRKLADVQLDSASTSIVAHIPVDKKVDSAAAGAEVLDGGSEKSAGMTFTTLLRDYNSSLILKVAMYYIVCSKFIKITK